jgi:DnaK suppressor protein
VATKACEKKEDRVKKKAVKPTAVKKKSQAAKSAPKKNIRHASTRGAVSAKLPEGQKKAFKDMLLMMRERIVGQIRSLKGDSLRRDDEVNNAEDGTDAFERQFALNLVSSENDAIFEIDEALQRLDEDAYGICEDCDGLVEMPRLKALPFVRKCVGCQSKSEAGKVKFRPLPAAEEI